MKKAPFHPPWESGCLTDSVLCLEWRHWRLIIRIHSQLSIQFEKWQQEMNQHEQVGLCIIPLEMFLAPCSLKPWLPSSHGFFQTLTSLPSDVWQILPQVLDYLLVLSSILCLLQGASGTSAPPLLLLLTHLCKALKAKTVRLHRKYRRKEKQWSKAVAWPERVVWRLVQGSSMASRCASALCSVLSTGKIHMCADGCVYMVFNIIMFETDSVIISACGALTTRYKCRLSVSPQFGYCVHLSTKWF